MTNERFGKLVVAKQAKSRNWRTYWLCKCDCGNEIEVMGKLLKNGCTKSCGCIRGVERGNQLRTHGLSETRIYNVWLMMKQRCFKKYSTSYKNYGGRGITVCNEWLQFENFYKWSLDNGYKEELEIDRMNVNGNYEPTNCRWTTTIVNANNKRNNRLITINGITKTVSQWGREYKISKGAIHARLKRGWEGERLLLPANIGNNQYSKEILPGITVSDEETISIKVVE